MYRMRPRRSFTSKFKINDYITLRLENRKTNIYVKSKLFRQCKSLFLVIPKDSTKRYNEINSIDGAANEMQHRDDLTHYDHPHISEREEFWAHCSNLQVWVEHGYDTRLLHSNLAFPLLKVLTEEGDPRAKGMLKEEIINRLDSGDESVITFLLNEGYVVEYLTDEEFLQVSLIPEELNCLKELQEELGFDLNYCHGATDKNTFYVWNKHVAGINICGNYLKKFPETLLKFKGLRKLYLAGNDFQLTREEREEQKKKKIYY